MLYQLPNGKVIEISTEQYFEMSDEQLQYLLAYNHGEEMENPWFGSILNRPSKDIDITDDEFSDFPDITDLTNDEKLEDLDIDPTMLD